MDRVAFDFGFIQIYWYSLFIAIALFVGVCIMLREARRVNVNEDYFTNLIFFGVIFAIIGARLYYVVFNWNYYGQNLFEILEIWNGGLAIHGGMLGGGIFTILYNRKHKVKTLKIIDIIVVGLIIGQAIGRWGNFFNQEAYGTVFDNLPNVKYIPEFVVKGMYINDPVYGLHYFHPTFLYESVLNIIGFIILVVVRRYRYIKVGQITSIYMVWYGVTRFIIESMRTDSLMLGSFKVAQIVSVLFVLCGVGLFLYQFRYKRFGNLYQDIDYKPFDGQ